MSTNEPPWHIKASVEINHDKKFTVETYEVYLQEWNRKFLDLGFDTQVRPGHYTTIIAPPIDFRSTVAIAETDWSWKFVASVLSGVYSYLAVHTELHGSNHVSNGFWKLYGAPDDEIPFQSRFNTNEWMDFNRAWIRPQPWIVKDALAVGASSEIPEVERLYTLCVRQVLMTNRIVLKHEIHDSIKEFNPVIDHLKRIMTVVNETVAMYATPVVVNVQVYASAQHIKQIEDHFGLQYIHNEFGVYQQTPVMSNGNVWLFYKRKGYGVEANETGGRVSRDGSRAVYVPRAFRRNMWLVPKRPGGSA